MDTAQAANAFLARLSAATARVDQANAQAQAETRRERAGIFDAALISGPRSLCHADVGVLLLAIKEHTEPRHICALVLSALAVSFSARAMAAAPSPLSIPTGVSGIPNMRDGGALKHGNDLNLYGKVVKSGPLVSSSGGPAITQRDASAMLAMAVYAAGKRLTADNMAGLLGGDTTGGRVAALKSITQCDDVYLKGDRSLKDADLRKINSAFSLEPGARIALFTIVSSCLAAPVTAYEAVVSSQARLLRSEGRGSYDRALMAIMAFSEVLIMVPSYRAEMERVIQVQETLAVESMAVRDFGFIMYQDAYETLKVSRFRSLATIGVLMMQDDPDSSAQRIEKPLSGKALERVTALYADLKKLYDARIAMITAETNKRLAEATAAASA